MRQHILVLFGFPLLLAAAVTPPAHAVPAFARREGATCQMCHFRVPELNEDGRAYVRRGLREEPGEMEAMGQTAGMGGKSTPGMPPAAREHPLGEPLALRWADYLSVMGHHMLNLQRGARPAVDAGVVDLWVGGPLSPRVSGLANPSFDIENGGADVEQAYGQGITRWTSRFGSLRFGQVLPFAILFNQGGPQMTLSQPAVLSTPADTGTTWTPTSLLRGAEIGLVNLPRWNLYAGAGQPHLEANDTMSAGRHRQEGMGAGSNRHTDFYTSAEYLWGSRGNSLTAYGYWGKASLAPDTDRRFHRLGLFANAFLPRTKGVAGFIAGSDTAADGRSLDNSGLFVLAERLIGERWAGYTRYDWLRRELAAGGSARTSGPTLGISWWAETEMRLTLEGQLLKTSGSPQDRAAMTELFWVF